MRVVIIKDIASERKCIKIFKTYEAAKELEKSIIEEFRTEALGIITNYFENGKIDSKWQDFDIENELIDDDDTEYNIRLLTDLCYKSIFIVPEEIYTNLTSDCIFTHYFDDFY